MKNIELKIYNFLVLCQNREKLQIILTQKQMSVQVQHSIFKHNLKLILSDQVGRATRNNSFLFWPKNPSSSLWKCKTDTGQIAGLTDEQMDGRTYQTKK